MSGSGGYGTRMRSGRLGLTIRGKEVRKTGASSVASVGPLGIGVLVVALGRHIFILLKRGMCGLDNDVEKRFFRCVI
jgi:hypothetical protein